MHLTELDHPIAIAMWDFSWLERRWTGAGYENWDDALDQLAERGYDAVRIDAFPHLLASDPEREWQLLPIWSEHDWGAPGPLRVSDVRSSLIEFITACRARGIRVALSSWYRQDTTDARMLLDSPVHQANAWIAVLDTVADAGLSDQILYVDLANEFPLTMYNPYAYPDGAGAVTQSRTSPRLRSWMAEAIADVRGKHPNYDYCYSFTSELTNARAQDVSALDLLELHIWMAEAQTSDFYQRIGYDIERSSFDPASYAALQHAEQVYRRDAAHWRSQLTAMIDNAARWSRDTDKPLVSTECWAVITYKDWPGLDWEWVKELCEFGVHTALATGRWAAIASSNFCGPQFEGMWRDIAWHRRITDAIHAGPRVRAVPQH